MLREVKSGVYTFGRKDNIFDVGDQIGEIEGIISLILPDGLEELPGAVLDDVSIKGVAIPPSLHHFERDAFSAAVEVVYIKDLESWCNAIFDNTYANPLNGAHHLFLNGEEIRHLKIPQGVKVIKEYAFIGCPITSVTVPDSVVSIEEEAFAYCGAHSSCN